MIPPCQPEDFEVIGEIINTAALAYKGVIPEDCWKDPYMPKEELLRKYWLIPGRQIKASVVLADIKWLRKRKEGGK